MASAAVAARQRARAARLRMQTDRDARDARIEEQVTAVLLAASSIDQADATLATARRTHGLSVRAAEKKIAAAAASLAGEGLTVAEVAGLLELAEKKVRRLIRDSRAGAFGEEPRNPAATDRAGRDAGSSAAPLPHAGGDKPGEGMVPAPGDAEAVGV